MNKKIFILILILILLIGAVYAMLEREQSQKEPTKSFITVKGETDLIKLFSPQVGEEVSSPLIIKGEARGTWFFEASFPVTLTNWDGLIIAEHYVQAQSDWMTEDYVPFEATLEFENPVFPEADKEHFSRRGYLILHKDNPSGLPENADALEITVKFK